jgi:hypothetical protein
MPRDIRRFERKPYLRMKTIEPGLYQPAQSLEKLANLARNRGYNARIIKNKSSHSLYIRPRRYNRPIPEIDPSRIATFPTALAKSKGSKIGREFLRQEMGLTTQNINDSEITDYISEVYSKNKNQIDGQQEEIEQWLDTYANQENELRELQIQSKYNLTDIESRGKGTYSNLTEDQWGLIQSEPKIAKLLRSDTMNNVLEKTAIKGLLDIQGIYRIENKIPYSEDLSFAEEGRTISLLSTKNGVTQTINEYPVSFFDMYFDKIKAKVLAEWRKDFISYLREEGGVSEHTLLASMLRKDSLEDIQYWKWPGYDRDVVRDLIKQETNLEPTSDGITLSINIDQAALESFFKRVVESAGIDNIIDAINRPYERKYYTEPRKTFSHGNETRQRIADYLWERKMTGDEVISTHDIQRHLSKNMKKPPVTRQTSKFLDQDPRFQDVGKVKKVKLWKFSGD